MDLMKSLIFILLMFSCTGTCFGFLEVIVGFTSYLYNKISCFDYCCTKNEIPGNFEALQVKLRNKIFGQPLVESTIVRALKSHWSERSSPDKALTISFHGGPGVGKNYVSKFIQEALYSKGVQSLHVHNFNARLDFPEVKDVQVYKNNLVAWIRGNVSRCPQQLFLFDEVQQMPAGVLDAVKPFIDHSAYVGRIDYRRSIFIFLSNTGSKVINEEAYKLWNMGIDRDNLRLHFFEKIIAQGAFNEKGGFHHSDTIKSNLIDHYVPFLPLMKSHVRKCIEAEFRKLGVHSPTENQIQEIMEYIDWGPNSDKGVFSKTGCKRISQKVRLIAP